MPLYSKVLPHIEEIVLEIISITRGNIKYMLCLHIAKCTRKCLINLIRIYKSIMLSPQSNFCNLFDHVNSIFSVCLFFTIFLICLFKFSLCPFYVENDHPNPRGAQEAWEVSGRYLPWYFTKFLWHWERSKASGEKSVPLGLNRWSLIGPAFSFILWLFQLERKKGRGECKPATQSLLRHPSKFTKMVIYRWMAFPPLSSHLGEMNQVDCWVLPIWQTLLIMTKMFGKKP